MKRENKKKAYLYGILGAIPLFLMFCFFLFDDRLREESIIFLIGSIATGVVIVLVYFHKFKGEEADESRRENDTADGTKKLLALLGSYDLQITHPNKETMDSGNLLFVLKGKGYQQKDYYYYIFKDPNIGMITYDTVSKKYGKTAPKIEVFEVMNSWLKYHPSEYVYTGVTVGGVTTGGVYDAGNYYTQKKYASGRYFLSLKTNYLRTYVEDKEERVKETMLIDEMFVNSKILDSARNDHMSTFLVSSNHFVFAHKMGTLDSKAFEVSQGNIGAQQILLNKATNEAELKKWECEHIRSFILNSLQYNI